MMYTFDVETSYRDGEAWVWSWGLCDEDLKVETGNGVGWLTPLLSLPDKAEVWIHNLPFDGEFVFWELIRNGWKLLYEETRDPLHGFFTPRIDISGMMSMTIHAYGKRITLRDSNRIFRCPLRDLPKLCGFSHEAEKDTMDYDEVREPTHIATPREKRYQELDVIVLMKAMQWVKSYGVKGNTVGSIALNDWKEFMGSSPFTPLTQEQRIALSSLYSGGVVYTPQSTDILQTHGRVYDRNSMYPAEACKELPIAIKSQINAPPPLVVWSGVWAVHVIAKGLKLKKNAFPLVITPFTGKARSEIQILDRWFFVPEWMEIQKQYTIAEFDIVQSVEFETAEICREFVYKWYGIKCMNDERRTFAKFILNNLTGKFGEWDTHELFRRELVGGGYLSKRFNEERPTPNKWAFMPAVAYITSNSRLALCRAAYASGIENLLYTDTDSIHTTGELPPEYIHDTRLGAWKVENTFTQARYIKPKSYWETGDKTVKRHAGLNHDATLAKVVDEKKGLYIDTGELISPENMVPGNCFFSRVARKVPGGVVIKREVKKL